MTTSSPKIDYLKQDLPVPGQKYALISMVEPKNSRLLKNRESFFCTRFLKGFLEEYTKTLMFKMENGEEKLTDLMKERLDLSYESIKNQYYSFQEVMMTELDTEFEQKYNEKAEPTVTGFKVRGTYPSAEVAQEYAKQFHAYEPAVNIYTTPVGAWVPYCPMSDVQITTEYAQEKLTKLMQTKTDEMTKKQLEFEHQQMKLKMEEEEKRTQYKEEQELKKQSAEVEEINDMDLLEILEEDDVPVPEPPKKKRGRPKKTAANRRKVNKQNK